jgi:hypothetical protein
MFFMLRVGFFLFTLFVAGVIFSLVYHRMSVSTGVMLGAVAIFVQCFGQVTNWDCFKTNKSSRVYRRKRMKKSLLTMLIVGLFAIPLIAQSVVDTYGPKIPAGKRIEVTSYHFWLAYFNGTNWNDEQKAFLEKAARDPMSIKFDQGTAFSLFTQDQVRDIFYKVGSFDTGV